MKILIVGAGIGGLTTALTLLQRGHDVTIFEAAPTLGPIGAGIWLAPNALQLLDQLDLTKQLLSQGISLDKITICDHNRTPIQTIDSSSWKGKYTYPTLSISRSQLQETLLSLIQPECLFLDKTCLDASQTKDRVSLRFADGTQAEGEIAIIADGIYSKLRQQLFPNSKIRRVRQLSFRGLAPVELDASLQCQGIEIWHLGWRFGFSQVGPRLVYWYLIQPQNKTAASSNPVYPREPTYLLDPSLKEQTMQTALDFIRSWGDPIGEILNHTSATEVIQTDLCDLIPLEQWTTGRIALLGDAAHAMTPNLGQGASQAVEDAFVLAACLGKDTTIESALVRYESLRKPRVERIMKWSHQAGWLSGIQHPFLGRFRNGMMRMLPRRIQQQQLAWLYDIKRWMGKSGL